MEIEKFNLQETELKEKGVFDWPIWQKERSEFPWLYDSNEDCYFLEGNVIVEYGDGKNIEIGPGDFVTFPKGLECTWKVLEPVKKHYRLY